MRRRGKGVNRYDNEMGNNKDKEEKSEMPEKVS